MLGAIVGDIVGSVYEFNNIRTTEFPLFSEGSEPTDDSIMTLAVARALLDSPEEEGLAADVLVNAMQAYGRQYPWGGYGGRFGQWLYWEDPQPYNSCGNGSAMRVSPVAWVSDDLECVEELARKSAEVTHNHPEGIKGAQVTAGCILLARQGATKEEIRRYAEERHGYDLGFTLDEIRPTYAFSEICQDSVPQALVAFLEGEDFEDVIRRAISIGGDSDTIAAIAGGIAQAYYGIPDWIVDEARARMDDKLLGTLDEFCERYGIE